MATVRRPRFNFSAPAPRAVPIGSAAQARRVARLQGHRHVGDEMSHRGKVFMEVAAQVAERDLRALMAIPAN